jgi:hypothetical protein
MGLEAGGAPAAVEPVNKGKNLPVQLMRAGFVRDKSIPTMLIQFSGSGTV